MGHVCYMNKDRVVISMENIVKKFGNFTANDGINLSLHEGEVLAILGENGAGKSTLMNILSGLLSPTSGVIKVDGKPVSFKGPKHASQLGIGMVHQHFMLVQPFTVAQNIVLGVEPQKGIVVDDAEIIKSVIAIAEKYNMDIDPYARVCDISVGMQQRVEILKVLYKGVQTLILDEPTASLTPQEIKELMGIVEALAKDGKSVIIITHKLKEIKECADRCMIIRGGKYIDTVDVAAVDESELASMMVGRKVSFKVEKKEVEAGEEVLKITDLHAKDYRGVEILKGFELSVKRGEIVGLAGVDGNGQNELVEIITGLKKADSGKVEILGIDYLNQTPKQVFDAGVSSIPADRQKHGLVLDFSVEDNLILQHYRAHPYAKHTFMDRNAISENAGDLIDRFDIRPKGCENKPAGQLSGGNQQKVIIAREVTNNKDLLIAFNPTRGLDVGAIEVVHKYIVEQRNKNKAVLLISYELDEILSLSDRIEVIFNGRISGSVDPESATEQELGLLMTGGKNDEENIIS